MTEPDVVEKLDEWLSRFPNHANVSMLQRARDEIVALRRAVDSDAVLISVTTAPKPDDSRDVTIQTRLQHRLIRARAEALEEAARACDGLTDPTTAKLYDTGCEDCAAAIRALKGSGNGSR